MLAPARVDQRPGLDPGPSAQVVAHGSQPRARREGPRLGRRARRLRARDLAQLEGARHLHRRRRTGRGGQQDDPRGEDRASHRPNAPTRTVRLPVSTPASARRSLPRIRRFLHDILEPRTYGRIAYLILALPLGIIESTILVTAISVGVGTAVMLIGIPILIGTVYAWRWLAVHERRMLRRLTGGPFPSPYRPDAEGAGRWARLGARLADPATWKDLVFLLLQLPAGIVSFTVAVSVLGVGCLAAAGARLVLGHRARRDRARPAERQHPRRGVRRRAAGRADPAVRHPGAGSARAALRLVRRPAARLERRPGAHRARDRAPGRPLADHRRRRRRAAAHRARPPRRRPAAAGRARPQPAHGAGSRREGRPGGGRADPQRGGGGEPRAQGAARPRPRHPPGDPDQPWPARRARGPRHALDRAGRDPRGARGTPARTRWRPPPTSSCPSASPT